MKLRVMHDAMPHTACLGCLLDASELAARLRYTPDAIADIIGDDEPAIPVLSKSNRRAIQFLFVIRSEAGDHRLRCADGLAVFESDIHDRVAA
jgi:hypothetical protein